VKLADFVELSKKFKLIEKFELMEKKKERG